MKRRLNHPRRWLLILAAAVAATAVAAPPATAETAQDVGVLCTVPSGHDPAVIATVYQVAMSRQVSDRVLLAGFEAGWIESHMNNLPCGDTAVPSCSQETGRPGFSARMASIDRRRAVVSARSAPSTPTGPSMCTRRPDIALPPRRSARIEAIAPGAPEPRSTWVVWKRLELLHRVRTACR
ncbi:hypothetical protein GCM10009853_072810 [Glycomyces scopariae]